MKEIFIFRGNDQESHSEFYRRMADLAKRSISSAVRGVKMISTLEIPPTFSVIPFKKTKISAISLYCDAELDVSEITTSPGFAGGYEVDEALPVDYVKNWPDFELTPGVCLLTLFNKKRNIDHDTFLNRWHNGHTPLSLKIHPLWSYNRNVVRKLKTEDSENWDGIVDEHFRTKSDLLNPFKFFGNPLVIIPRMLKVYSDVNSFLDYKTIETYYARETWIKSF